MCRADSLGMFSVPKMREDRRPGGSAGEFGLGRMLKDNRTDGQGINGRCRDMVG